MRFLLLNQFYPPDPAPTGQYLHGLAEALVRRGHQVDVLCSSQSYDGTARYPRHSKLNGVEIFRLPATGFGRRGLPGRISDYVSFYFSLLTALTFHRPRPDLIVSLTTPPYIGLLGKLAAWRHQCGHAHWIMDIYPDVVFAHGMARNDGLICKFLKALTRFQLKGAKTVLALGPTMAERLSDYARKSHSVSRVSWIPLWSNPALAPEHAGEPNRFRVQRGWSKEDVVFLYSGNMGLGHRFDEFLEAARILGSSGPRWVFAGGGKRRAEIETFAKSHPEARIEFLGYVPQQDLCEHLCAADIHLASLDSAWQGLMVPSKLQGSFAVARPVLYVGEQNNETATWISESMGGWVVGENDSKSLLDAIRSALDQKERRARGDAALKFAQHKFNMADNCTRIAELFETDGIALSNARVRNEPALSASEVGSSV